MSSRSILSQDVISFFFIFLHLFFTKLLYSQNPENPNFTDSTLKTTAKDTSSKCFTPIPNLGSKGNFINYFSEYKKDKLLSRDVLAIEEIFESFPGLRLLNYSALGLSKPVLINGILGFTSTLWNGINSQEPFFGLSTFDFYPILMFEKIELFEGLESFVFSNTWSGLSFNFITRSFDSKIPYSQIWIGQGGYNFLGSAAVISQNILPNINAFFSYERFWSGGRFENSQADRWNILGGARLNLSSNFNLKIENRFTNWGAGLNAGINPYQSPDIFEHTTAVVNLKNFRRRIYQNDLNLSYAYKLFSDSTLSLFGNFVLSLSSLSEEKDSIEFPHLSKRFESTEFDSKSLRVDQRLNYFKPKIAFTVGFEFWKFNKNFLNYIINSDFGNFFIYGLTNFSLSKKLVFIGGFRFGEFENFNRFSLGSKFFYRMDSIYSLFLEVNHLQKMEVISINGSEDSEKDFLLRIGSDYNSKSVKLALRGFYRNFKEYGIYEPVFDSMRHPISIILTKKINYNAFGIDAVMSFPLFWNIASDTRLSVYASNFNKTNNDFFPNFVINQAFKFKYVRAKSIAEIGISFELLSPFLGYTYLPQWNLFVRSDYKLNWQNNGIEIFARLRLGNAQINLSLLNLLGTNFMYIPIYPEYDRHIRISLIWSFND